MHRVIQRSYEMRDATHVYNNIAMAADRIAAVFPWYRQRLEVVGYLPDRDPDRLPVIDEGTLETHYYRDEAYTLAAAQVFRTTGTSSRTRKRIYWSEDDHAHYLDHRTLVLANFLGAAGRTACADLGTGHAAASALEIFHRLGRRAFSIDFTRPIDEHIATLNARRPDILFTMPMILDQMLVAGTLKHKPRKVIVLGDVAPLTWQRAVAEHLGIGPIDVLDLYGSIEVGAIAYYSHRDACYMFHDHIIPEALPAGECFRGQNSEGAVLLLTSTARTYFPAIRYVTGDLVVGLERQRLNGRQIWCYKRLDGRIGHELKHGERISIHSIATAVSTVLPIALWEVHKTSGRLLIRIQSSGLSDDAAQRIKYLIRTQNPDVDQMILSGLVEDIEVSAGTVSRTETQAKHIVGVGHHGGCVVVKSSAQGSLPRD
jgi:fumarate---(S)-2,3-diaminopropanoate ligase